MFQRWVAAELQARLWPMLHVSERPAYSLDDDARLPVRPDLVVMRGARPALVLQASHRLVGASSALSQEVSALLLQAASLPVPTALLVYADAEHPPEPQMRIRGTGTRLLCLPLTLDATPDALSARLDEIAELVRVSALGPLPQRNRVQASAVVPTTR